MLDHIVIYVEKDDFEKVVSWYLSALAPLGYEKMMDFGETVGLGAKPKADFWITCAAGNTRTGYLHLGLQATDHATVDAFYEAAVKAGGKSNGEPGIRTMYHPNYYGAFVFDPIGNNIEVVDHSGGNTMIK